LDWTQLKTIVGLVSAVVTGAIAQVLGGWDMWLQALVLFVVLDYITGLMAAAIEKKLRGVMKKVFIFCLVAVAFQADMLLGTEIIRVAVIGFYLGTEGLSILENATRAGLPIPDTLKDTLIQIKGNEKKVGV